MSQIEDDAIAVMETNTEETTKIATFCVKPARKLREIEEGW
ncbi:hypothetical protein [Desertifilum sp. FACHB-868]|nr:hypothetical protein [Desertifilum sp. FACHB-868]